MALKNGELIRSLPGISIKTFAKSLEIETGPGRLSGVQSLVFDNVTTWSFLGVPFAEPPIGQLRFQPPQPKKPWQGTFQANTLSPACYQNRDTAFGTFWGSDMWNPNTPISEDCLYLNIWVPDNARNLPVMIFIFGGGFYSGSPSLSLYDGKVLAALGKVIVVNINYRLGPFGFLYADNEEAPGNVGLLDQQMAIKWVHDNIAAFGGNRYKVTLFGESAGAASVTSHLIAPESRPLFQNAILQSGTLLNIWAMHMPDKALTRTQMIAMDMGCGEFLTMETLPSVMACLRQLPAETLSKWQAPNLTFLDPSFTVVSQDSNFFQLRNAYQVLQSGDFVGNVNLIVGTNKDEGNYFLFYWMKDYFKFNATVQTQLTEDDFKKCLELALGAYSNIDQEALLNAYGNNSCGTVPGLASKCYVQQLNEMIGDFCIACDAYRLAEQFINKSSTRVFAYYFDQSSATNPWPKWTGTMHGYELQYVFGEPLRNTTAGYSATEMEFSQKVIEYWTGFARDGIPSLKNSGSTQQWPEYKTVDLKWMLLNGDTIKPIDGTMKQRQCDVWRRVRDKQISQYSKNTLSTSNTRRLVVGVDPIVPVTVGYRSVSDGENVGLWCYIYKVNQLK